MRAWQAWLARGRRLGVATPCNRAVFDLLSVHAEGAAVRPATVGSD